MNKIEILRKFMKFISAPQHEELNMVKMFNRFFNKEQVYNYRRL